MHIIDFENLLEHQLETAIRKCFPLLWRENTVSEQLALELPAKFKTINLVGGLYQLTIAWEFYKLTGTPEYDHGDIGILVRRRLADRNVIEGAGFLEAKIRDAKSGKFTMRSKQSKRILTQSPHTQLLLYDHNPVPVLDYFPNSMAWGWVPYPRDPELRSVISYGPLLPFNLAAAIGQYDGSLYRFCHSFSQQFTRRYFSLLDLDFRTGAIQAVKGFPGKFGSPNIILTLRIAATEEDLPEDVRPLSERYVPVG